MHVSNLPSEPEVCTQLLLRRLKLLWNLLVTGLFPRDRLSMPCSWVHRLEVLYRYNIVILDEP